MSWWEFFFVMLVLLPVLVIWLGCVIDAISRPDLNLMMKAGWVLFILALPVLGALLYIILRPRTVVGSSSIDEVWDTPSPTAEERDRQIVI